MKSLIFYLLTFLAVSYPCTPIPGRFETQIIPLDSHTNILKESFISAVSPQYNTVKFDTVYLYNTQKKLYNDYQNSEAVFVGTIKNVRNTRDTFGVIITYEIKITEFFKQPLKPLPVKVFVKNVFYIGMCRFEPKVDSGLVILGFVNKKQIRNDTLYSFFQSANISNSSTQAYFTSSGFQIYQSTLADIFLKGPTIDPPLILASPKAYLKTNFSDIGASYNILGQSIDPQKKKFTIQFGTPPDTDGPYE